jgi:AcrR family transcriptional regulator
MEGVGRRERKKAEVRRHISDMATTLFAERGFDDVSVSEIAERADVARPTVFAYFPRKEDLVFDRTSAVTMLLVEAAHTSQGSPVQAVCDVLVAPGALGGFGATVSESARFWRLVAGSRVLLARARELAEEIEAAVAREFRARGVVEPELCAALVAAAYRQVHLEAIRRVLDGDPPKRVDLRRTTRMKLALGVVAQAAERVQARSPASASVRA